MRTVIAKFVCIGAQHSDEYQSTSVNFMAVTSGSEENKSFSKYTPSASLQMTISDETEASNFFVQGKEYYLTFKAAE